MASELRVDKIIPTTGVPTNGTGGVIQTVFTQFKSTTLSTSSTSFIDTGTSATITPKFATSKILIHSNFFYWFGSATERDYCVTTIYRDSTNLGTGNLGNNKLGGLSSGSGGQNSMQWYQSGDPMATFNNGASFTFVDCTHNSTSALTYKLYLRQNTAGGTLYYGWDQQVNFFMLQELSA
jgi:hypothetical protein